jgi:FkbH-like protein
MAALNVAEFKTVLKAGQAKRAFELLRHGIRPEDPFVDQARVARLFRSVPAGELNLRPLRVGLLASTTVDHLADVLGFWLAVAGFAAEIYLAPFDTIVHTVLRPESQLYAFKPDVVWLFTSYRDIHLGIAPGDSAAGIRAKVADAVERQAGLWRALLGRLNCTVLQNNADCPANDPFGNLSGTAVWGSRNVFRLYNYELGASALPGVVVYDLDHAASLYGKRQWFEGRYWFHSRHAFAPDATGPVAASAARLIAAARGMARKCLVLDLDNTLWGGVIGDDGLDGIKLGVKADGEAFSAFQGWVRDLKERGIVLAVCSKNEEIHAREPFERHPDMKLRLEDIAVFRANWKNKVDNLRDIALTLNIGIDSLVFVDDNPAEREAVRRFLPEVEVPELPEDPAAYVDAMAHQGYFETISFSDEDRERANYYRDNAKRAELQLDFKDVASWLRGLEMVADVGCISSFHLPRMAQLINKSNQFHLTGTRYSEADLSRLAALPDYTVRYFRLRDRFGDNGMVAVVVLRQIGDELHFDTWVMSCRVLGRSLEEFICNEVIRIARERGCRAVTGCYRPSARNQLVAGLYERLGFNRLPADEGVTMWQLSSGTETGDLTTYIDRVVAGRTSQDGGHE